MRAALLAVLCLGCTAVEPAAAPLEEAPTLVALGDQGPGVGDARPHLRVAFRAADGSTTPVDLEASALVPRWRDGAALIDPEGRLYQVWPDGRRRMLAPRATALGTDGERLVFAVERDLGVELRVHDGTEAQTLAEGLSSAAMLRVDHDRVRFVGARPGGVAGVWVADASGARCRTNCDLRTGEPWGDRFVPPPSDPSQLEAW
ncbi:MAG: hypothetical protein KC619_21370 [Myxococcales bacterium]|nr:hypothetical protein [Myxococcales bacterium]